MYLSFITWFSLVVERQWSKTPPPKKKHFGIKQKKTINCADSLFALLTRFPISESDDFERRNNYLFVCFLVRNNLHRQFWLANNQVVDLWSWKTKYSITFSPRFYCSHSGHSAGRRSILTLSLLWISWIGRYPSEKLNVFGSTHTRRVHAYLALLSSSAHFVYVESHNAARTCTTRKVPRAIIPLETNRQTIPEECNELLSSRRGEINIGHSDDDHHHSQV